VAAAAEVVLAGLVVLGHNLWHVVPNEVPILLVAGWVSLRLRRLGWRGVGLVRPRSWLRTVAWAVGIAAAVQGFGLLVLDPLLERTFGRAADLSEFRPLVGNLRLTLAGLAVVWTFAAFGEELVYRGYLMSRAADAGDRSPGAWVASLGLVVVLFAVAHAYKGAPGMIDSGLSALVLGTAYIRSGRNLWLPILTHGLIDTFALALVYTGAVAV
jgi:membrane protease YdiL (CAAX protease family)